MSSPHVEPPAPPVTPSLADPLAMPRLGCRTQHARRLLVAAGVFAVSLLATLALVATFIIRDLSESRVNRILSQARQEAEAVAQVAGDPSTLGEGELVAAVDGGRDSAIDSDALLAGMLPELYDESGKKLPSIEGGPQLGAGLGLGGDVPARTPRRVPANFSSQGKEFQWLVNGEMVQRDAFQFIEIRYPGGRQILRFSRSDIRDWDKSILSDPSVLVQRLERKHLPNSKRITMSWDSTIDGQPVTLQAGIDPSVLDEAVAELRSRTIPKVIAGGAVFVVLLGMAYAYVFRLLGESRRLEVEAGQQALLAQVGMLAAGLAHEIRNPLSAVQMNLQLLEEDLQDCAAASSAAAPPSGGVPAGVSATGAAVASELPGGTGDHVAVLHATQREIRRLGLLVSDFLAYARPTTPRPMPVRLDALVRDNVELFRANATGVGVTLEVDLQSGDDPVMLDEAMLKQALTNVLKNALEAAPQPGGRVVIATSRASDSVRISVTDNGPGLPRNPEELFRVFHSTKKGGTGLGLPISRALVERQRGTLSARTAPSGGAVFTLSLPVTAPVAAEAAA